MYLINLYVFPLFSVAIISKTHAIWLSNADKFYPDKSMLLSHTSKDVSEAIDIRVYKADNSVDLTLSADFWLNRWRFSFYYEIINSESFLKMEHSTIATDLLTAAPSFRSKKPSDATSERTANRAPILLFANDTSATEDVPGLNFQLARRR